MIVFHDPVADAMCFILGYMEKERGKGLNGSAGHIKDGIALAKQRFNLRVDQVASLHAIFNVK